MGEKTLEKPHRVWRIVIAAGLVIVLLIALGAVLYMRGGIAPPQERARADAERGYEEWSGPFREEAAARQAALEPVLGEPIGETWYIICTGVRAPLIAPTAQFCDLDVQTTYAIDWSDPDAEVAALITALEGTEATTGDEVTAGQGGPWTAFPRDREEPIGKVAEAGSHGTVYIYAPGHERVASGGLPPVDLFPDGVITQQTVPDSEPPAGHGEVSIRRGVGFSRTNIGCLPDLSLGCSTVLDEAAMPRIDAFS